MDFLPITLQELRYLVAVADHKHFGRAAEACNVSQPALSVQLKKLEDVLNVQLVERNGRSVQLTAVGERVVTRARKVLEESYNLVDEARQEKAPLSTALHLGTIPTVGPYFLHRFLPQLRQRYPQLHLFLTEDKTQDILTRLHDGRIDCALLALPIEDTSVEHISIGHEPFLLALPSKHPLCHKELIAPADLNKADLLLLEEGHCLREHALQACQTFGVRERTDFHATSLETLKHMVAAGTGITLLPELASEQLPEDVVLKSFTHPVPTREIALVFRRGSARRHDFGLLAKMIADAI